MKGSVPVASKQNLEPIPVMTYGGRGGVGGGDDYDDLVPNSQETLHLHYRLMRFR
jgi:hypothetical protein